MKKKAVAFGMTMMLGILLTFTNFVPLRLADLATRALGVIPETAPEVIPRLREWHQGTGLFALNSTSRIILDPSYAAQLIDTAKVFQGDLYTVSGHRLPVVMTRSPQAGDFFLTLNSRDHGLGKEGYFFKVEDFVTISANTSTGIFYGTRTALQILLQDSTRTHIVKGVARDYPRYAERGFMLDAGRKFFSISALENYVKLMAWYKMNDFHIHLNDNVLGGGDSPDWMHAYAAFRLNSSRFKGLAARDGSYTEQDIRELQAVAKEYAVTITPEIDTPAHALAFTQYRPDLASQKYAKEMLDLDNPNTYTFLNSIWNEFLPWFDTSQVDIGADEYPTNDADKYRQFINTYDAYLRQKGKTVRMWGGLSEMRSNVRVNTDIVLDVWNNRWANPVEMVNQGFSVINANDNLLYIVPKAGYYHDYLDTRLLYEQWEPYIFDLANPDLNLRPNDPHLLGGMFSVWNDKLGTVVSDADVSARVQAAMPTVGAKLWGSLTIDMTYEQFENLIGEVGQVPGTNFV